MPAESVAADNVVDGLALLKLAGYDGTNQPDWKRLVSLGHNVSSLIEPILADAAERIDALADLLLAEAVHHTLAGTPMRAGAAGDLLAGGPVGCRVASRNVVTGCLTKDVTRHFVNEPLDSLLSPYPHSLLECSRQSTKA